MTSSPDAFVPLTLPELSSGRARPVAPLPLASNGTWALPELRVNPGGRRDPLPRRTDADEAYERGLGEGLSAGTARAEAALRPAIEALARVTEQLAAAEERFARDRARNVHSLALAVAQKLIQREVAADATIVSGLVAQALELLPLDAPIEVRLNPVDWTAIAAVSGEKERLEAAGRSRIQWVPDPALERGSFLLESALRVVDGRADVALRTLYERLGDE